MEILSFGYLMDNKIFILKMSILMKFGKFINIVVIRYELIFIRQNGQKFL